MNKTTDLDTAKARQRDAAVLHRVRQTQRDLERLMRMSRARINRPIDIEPDLPVAAADYRSFLLNEAKEDGKLNSMQHYLVIRGEVAAGRLNPSDGSVELAIRENRKIVAEVTARHRREEAAREAERLDEAHTAA